MATVVCGIDGRPASGEALRTALERCRTRGDRLHLVGVVEPPRREAPSPCSGERVRRFQDVEYALVHAARAAKRAGIRPSISIRSGALASETVAEAAEVGAVEAIHARHTGTLRPHVEVERTPLVAPEKPIGLRPAAA